MKYLKYAVLLITLYACGSKKVKEEEINKEKPPSSTSVTPSELVQTSVSPAASSESTQPTKNYNYQLLDSSIRQDVVALDQVYVSVPFYMFLDDKKHFIISDGIWDYDMPHFNGEMQYGIIDSNYTPILPMTYDKIYNPDLTLKQCFEIKKGNKVGLFNYTLGTVLTPQFDYIYPDKDKNKQVAYGLKEGTWFKIDSDLTTTLTTDFSPIELIKNLSFDVTDSKNRVMYVSYNESYPNEMGTGKGVVVLPSYLEQLELLGRPFYDDIILPQQEGYNSGTMSAELAKTKEKSITDKITSFFISMYEEGVDGRGYHSESEELVIYNSENNQLNSYHLVSLNQSHQLCRESGYRILFDSLIEVKQNDFHSKTIGYDFGPIYEYHKINSNGELVPLVSDRHFDFTKFTLIKERHFRGCYARSMENPTEEHNYWKSDHLTIEELDIMRNEIFADYGYKFKTEKWQQYFGTKTWYTPKYDDVNDLLSEIEKANIKTILSIKASMKGREDEVVNKQAIGYAPAG